MDPVLGLAKLSDGELTALADALFRHLDAGKPEFGAKSWYDAVVDELAARKGWPLGGAKLDLLPVGEEAD
ncbi:hypothetical protein AB6813_12770 [bacterium RCC_150]